MMRRCPSPERLQEKKGDDDEVYYTSIVYARVCNK